MWFFGVALGVLAACTKPAPLGLPIADPIPMPAGPTQASPFDPVLVAYEQVREKLAADDAWALRARKLADEATAAKLDVLAMHAAKLASAADLVAARVEFAAVSREIVTLIAKHRELAKNRHVFECPMVKGYNKWVQPSSEMANPYMGPAMLACGGESTWE